MVNRSGSPGPEPTNAIDPRFDAEMWTARRATVLDEIGTFKKAMEGSMNTKRQRRKIEKLFIIFHLFSSADAIRPSY